MEENNKLAGYARWQCIFTAVAAVCCLGVLVAVLTVLPQVRTVAGQMEAVLTDLEAVSGTLNGELDTMLKDMDTVLANLDTVTQELAQADLKGMVEDVDAFVTTGQSAVEQATEKLNIIDFETMNRAIQNLADVVEPLARFFNVFN